MRIEPRNRWLAVLLALLLALYFALRPDLPNASDAGPLFPGFDAAKVTRVLIERGAEPDVERVELFRVDDPAGPEDARWVVRQAFAHPAEDWAVAQLLVRVAALRSSDRVAREASSRALYGVDDGGVRVLLGGAEGAVLAAFVQGRPDEATGDVRGSYVRPVSAGAGDGDENGVYRAPLLAPVEPRAERWLDSRVLPLAPEDVVWLRLRLAARGPELALKRGADGAWRLTPAAAGPGGDDLGIEVPAVRVESALEVATGVFFEEVVGTGRVGDAAGFEEPGLVLELACGPDAGTPPAALVLGASPGPTEPADARLALHGPGPEASGPNATGLLGGENGWIVAVPRASIARLEESLEALVRAADEARRR